MRDAILTENFLGMVLVADVSQLNKPFASALAGALTTTDKNHPDKTKMPKPKHSKTLTHRLKGRFFFACEPDNQAACRCSIRAWRLRW